MLRALLVACLFVLSVPMSARSAEASCRTPLDGSSWPRMGATDVPTNMRFWYDIGPFWEPLDDSLRYEFQSSEASEPVAGRTSVLRFEDTALLSISPEHELAPRTKYALLVMSAANASRGVMVEFVTGQGPDNVPPAVPEVAIRSLTSRSSLEGVPVPGEEDIVLMFPGMSRPAHIVEFGISLEGGLFVFVKDSTHTDFDPGSLSGFLLTASNREEVFVGWSDCVRNWPDAQENALISVRFGVVDVAGNFSGWGELVEVRLPGHDEGR